MRSEDDTDFISEHFAEGKALREHGLVDKAAEQFEAIVARFPDNLEARQELRELYEERNQPTLPPGLASVLEWVDHFISNGFVDEARDALREARERYAPHSAWQAKARELGLDDDAPPAPADAQLAIGTAYHTGLEPPADRRQAMAWYQRAAEQGHADAAYALAWAFADWMRSPQQAIEWFRKAAALGNADAHDALGAIYRYDRDRRPSDGLQGHLIDWIRREASHGHAEAQFTFGMALSLGDGVVRNLDEAARWYREAAIQGHSEARLRLATALAVGAGVPMDQAEAVAQFHLLAEAGHAGAEHALALAYETGWGVESDPHVSEEWLRRAAKHGADGDVAMVWLHAAGAQGDAQAQFMLGLAYGPGLKNCRQICYGQHVWKDNNKAVQWFRQAAEAGHRDAQFNLGVAYSTGEGVARDLRVAMAWYLKAAEQGHPEAQYALAWGYANGRGVAENPRLARDWQNRAARSGLDATLQEDLMWALVGDAEAQFRLSKSYTLGTGVPQDEELADEWLRKAADGGCADAQYTMGLHAERDARGFCRRVRGSVVCGVGDPAAAGLWFRRAAELGHKGAQLALARHPAKAQDGPNSSDTY